MDKQESLRRWRLILGRYAAQSLPNSALGGSDTKLEQSLEYLYGREYDGRGLVQKNHKPGAGGSLDPSAITAINWLNQTRNLFPRQVFERMQSQAIERYQLTELLTDPNTINSIQTSPELVKALMGMRGRMSAPLREAVKALIARTVDEITRKIKSEFVNALLGRRNRQRPSMLKSSQNFDARATIVANLKNYDSQAKRLVIERPRFISRVKRSMPWDVILCVDQSGSMMDSVLYSAVIAGIMSSLPAVRVRLVVFDTNVVDLTHLAHDPVEVLLTVQLGGGTDIGKAVSYCERLVNNPNRTIFTLISDFEEGAVPNALLAAVQRLAQSRVTLLGLAALDSQAQPVYDRQMAQRLSNKGMHIAALTPVHFANWLAEVMN